MQFVVIWIFSGKIGVIFDWEEADINSVMGISIKIIIKLCKQL